MSRTVKTSVIGSYPVPIDTLEIMKDYFDEKESSWESYIHQATSEMVSAGIDIVSDGQTRDPFIQLFTRYLSDAGSEIEPRLSVLSNTRVLSQFWINSTSGASFLETKTSSGY